jgi:hypothetical protein
VAITCSPFPRLRRTVKAPETTDFETASTSHQEENILDPHSGIVERDETHHTATCTVIQTTPITTCLLLDPFITTLKMTTTSIQPLASRRPQTNTVTQHVIATGAMQTAISIRGARVTRMLNLYQHQHHANLCSHPRTTIIRTPHITHRCTLSMAPIAVGRAAFKAATRVAREGRCPVRMFHRD